MWIRYERLQNAQDLLCRLSQDLYALLPLHTASEILHDYITAKHGCRKREWKATGNVNDEVTRHEGKFDVASPRLPILVHAAYVPIGPLVQ
jgi:hypothetical protein